MSLIILLLLLTVANAMGQKEIPIQIIPADQCETMEFSVVNWPGDRYTWDLYTGLKWDTVNFAWQKGNVEPVPYFEDGNYQGSTVHVNWLEAGRYILRVTVWDEEICSNNLMVIIIDVKEHIPEAVLTGDSACYGEPVEFKIVLTGLGPWDLKYTYGDGNVIVNLNGVSNPVQTIKLPPLPVGTTDIWVKEIVDQCTSNLMSTAKARVIIYPVPVNSKIFQIDD